MHSSDELPRLMSFGVLAWWVALVWLQPRQVRLLPEWTRLLQTYGALVAVLCWDWPYERAFFESLEPATLRWPGLLTAGAPVAVGAMVGVGLAVVLTPGRRWAALSGAVCGLALWAHVYQASLASGWLYLSGPHLGFMGLGLGLDAVAALAAAGASDGQRPRAALTVLLAGRWLAWCQADVFGLLDFDARMAAQGALPALLAGAALATPRSAARVRL